MSDLRTTVDQLNQMILEGKTLEAFEKFYAEDVVMQDNDYPARVGKDVNRQYEETFVNGLTEFRGAKVVNTIISDGLAVVEWWMDSERVKSITESKSQKVDLPVAKIAIPFDLEELKTRNLEAASEWQLQVRQGFQTHLSNGLFCGGFERGTHEKPSQYLFFSDIK